MNTLIWVLALFIFFLDQISKHLVLRTLEIGKSVEIIKNFFYLTLVRNTGAAFGIFKNQTLFFIAISVITVIAILIYIGKRRDYSFIRDTGLALILGGALGNLADRLRFGCVVDFLDFRIWPVFNVADSAITVGALLLIFGLLPKKRKGNTA